MPSAIPPQLNASLMRELRMIFKTFMAHRTTDRVNASNYGKQSAPATPALKCGMCMEVTSNAKDAVTIYDGKALCQMHFGMVVSLKQGNRVTVTQKGTNRTATIDPNEA